jgi:hypothetical protein
MVQPTALEHPNPRPKTPRLSLRVFPHGNRVPEMLGFAPFFHCEQQAARSAEDGDSVRLRDAWAPTNRVPLLAVSSPSPSDRQGSAWVDVSFHVQMPTSSFVLKDGMGATDQASTVTGVQKGLNGSTNSAGTPEDTPIGTQAPLERVPARETRARDGRICSFFSL